MFVVFDLDGTLACMKHRQPMIAAWEAIKDGDMPGWVKLPAPDWDGFYRACVHDAPIAPLINTMRAFHAAGARVEIWTGRSDLVRAETEAWLMCHGAPRVRMQMREHGNHEPDTKLKRRWLSNSDSVPNLVFEDRARVVSMFRAEGITVAQVAEGDF